VQVGFLLTCIWIGVEFTLWVHQLQSGSEPTLTRPPGVEGFLPISALISLKYWLLTGVFNRIHPSALVLLLIILTTGVLLKKGFCSWVCPVGLLSEYLAKFHALIFKKSKDLPKPFDYPLRGLKYVLLTFFLWAVLVQMDVATLERFIHSPYNKVADVKMWAFFAEPSTLTLWVLGILIALSVALPYFWCRYLCPYGAFLGVLSVFSLFKIQRNEKTCIDCGKCAKVCPARLTVDVLQRVKSDECHACLQCVDACPVKDTLYMGVTQKKAKLPRLAYAIIMVVLFLVGTSVARLASVWQNQIPNTEYIQRIQHLNDPVYQHNRGQVPEYEKDSGYGIQDSEKP
jgi:polyferredoxin